MLNAASIKALTDLGVDFPALKAAMENAAEVNFPITLKRGEIKLSDTEKLHIYDDAGHNGLIGRVKNEVLAQATELGVKAVAAQAGVDYKGNDPVKLLESVTAKLNLPVDEKIKEKDKDIAALKSNWETEKKNREAIEARLKDREEIERDISFFPENRIKSVKDRTLRMEMKEDGITIGEYDDNGVKKIAVFENGEVKKNTDRTLADPKPFLAEHFKTRGWIQEATVPPTDPKKSTFDAPSGPGKPTPTHESIHAAALAASGGIMNDKYQAVYTEMQLAK